MTEAPPTPTPARTTDNLAELLVAVEHAPTDLIERLRSAREAAVDEAGMLAELYEIELRFLREQAWKPAAAPELRAGLDRSECAALEFQSRALRAAAETDVAALFDLAELRAALRGRGDDAEAAAIGAELTRRTANVPFDDALREEARERYVALSTEEEELRLEQRIMLLEETSGLLLALAARADDRLLRRLGRRLGRACNDRRLQHRLERVLTRRGASFLELASLTLLIVLFVLLAAEATLPLSVGTLEKLEQADIAICLFFIAEFLFKLALSSMRISWFLRNAVTDLIPALPAVLVFLNLPNVVGIRALRFLRIAYFARYIQALRPLLRLFRLLLFMVRGMDHLIGRFSPLLNRNFIFFDRETLVGTAPVAPTVRQQVFQALRREHVLLAELPDQQRTPILIARSSRLVERLAAAGTASQAGRSALETRRDVPVEQVIEYLHALRPDELSMWMPRQDVLALDRVVRVINAPLIRSLPFVRKLRSPVLGTSPQQRVVDLGKRVANRLEYWRERVLFFADMSGILTGPQILDRIATALVNASKRPAVRLLLFGGLFVIVRMLVGEGSAVGTFLERFVATPLLILGGVCLILLSLGRWMKGLAGEAAESLKRTSEAHFIGLLELLKSREESDDLRFLARRVFRWELDAQAAQEVLQRELAEVRCGMQCDGTQPPPEIHDDFQRVALLYLHFLDGAILHESDIKTSEQLLANLSLENIRSDHLGFTRRDRKRLRKLSLDEGPLVSGPYLWFRCITESVALETAKRVIDYNRHCLPLARLDVAPAGARERMVVWLEKQRAALTGRILERMEPPDRGTVFATTQFNALNFLSTDADRDENVRRVFGDEVMEMLRRDRTNMIREIFGTTPLDRLPRARRVVNFYALYMNRLSGGRILLMPVYWLMLLCRLLGMGVGKTVEIVREITSPERAERKRLSGRAAFAVALRKIHRMKAPGLLEAMATRAAFDPAYCGAPPSWSEGHAFEHASELESDMDFLDMRERDREELRGVAGRLRRRVEECHFRMRALPALVDGVVELERRLGERAVTIAYVTDRDAVRSLLCAEQWFESALRRFESREVNVPASPLLTMSKFLLRGCRRHPVNRWLYAHHQDRNVSRRARRKFKAAWATDPDVRAIVAAWTALPPGVAPGVRGLEVAQRTFRDQGALSRELSALRAVQSLSVLDVRNYRKLVFRLGEYADEGEDPAVADALPGWG